MSNAPASSPSTGYRWLWIATLLGAVCGFAYGLIHLVVFLMSGGSGIAAARNPLGAVLLLVPLAAWFLATTSSGALFGMGLSAWLVARSNDASDHPSRHAAASHQLPLASLSAGTLAIAAAAWIAWLLLGDAATLGTGIFLAVWPPFVAWTSVWILVVLSAWQKLSDRVSPSGEEWWQRIPAGLLESLPANLARILWNAVVAALGTGIAWAVLLIGTGMQERGTTGLSGLSPFTRTWALVLAGVIALQLVALGMHAWNLRGVAIGSLKRKVFDLAVAWLPLERLPQLPEAPAMLRRALVPNAELPWILRFLWKRAASRFEPVFTHWDRWSGASDPRAALGEVLDPDGPDDALLFWTCSLQITLSILWVVLA